MKLFFNSDSSFYKFRWIIVITLIISVFMAYHDLWGGRIFAFKSQQSWSSSGPGYHK